MWRRADPADTRHLRWGDRIAKDNQAPARLARPGQILLEMIAWHAVPIMHQNIDAGSVEMPAQQRRRGAPVGDNHGRVMPGQRGAGIKGKLMPPPLPPQGIGFRCQRSQ